MEQATDGAETAAIDGLVSSWSENISVSFCLRAPRYGLTLWCALRLLVGGAIRVPQLQLQLQYASMIRSRHVAISHFLITPVKIWGGVVEVSESERSSLIDAKGGFFRFPTCCSVAQQQCITRNSSGDEIANVNFNFLYDDIVHVLQNTIDSCIHSATDRRGYVLERMFTKFSKITQYNGHYVVQSHSRSPILVPIESSYTTSY